MEQTRRAWVLALCLGLWASCSYSEPFSYGQTTNAAGSGLSWDMGTVLPKETGLTVNGVIYQYTAVKRPEDAMLVHVQNLNAKGNGYIFRETDDWSGRPGNTINKAVAVDNVPIGYWGRGSIAVEGSGQVLKPNVVYTYRVDHCFDPQSSPSCPGYKPIIPEVTIEPYSALDDAAVQRAMAKTEQEYKEAEAKKEAIKEKALKDSENALADANGLSQSMILQSMNLATNVNLYYSLRIDGGIYRDTVVLKDSKLPENRLGLRNGLAQQLLHSKMIDMQYER